MSSHATLPAPHATLIPQLLTDKDENARAAAAQSLAEVSDQPEPQQALTQALAKDSSLLVRFAAAHALEKAVSHPKIQQILIQTLRHDQSEQVRCAAAQTLGAVAALPPVQRALKASLQKESDLFLIESVAHSLLPHMSRMKYILTNYQRFRDDLLKALYSLEFTFDIDLFHIEVTRRIANALDIKMQFSYEKMFDSRYHALSPTYMQLYQGGKGRWETKSPPVR